MTAPNFLCLSLCPGSAAGIVRAIRISTVTSVLLLVHAAAHAADSVPTTDSPRLAVVISIDQCRADYLDRFRPYFVESGFRRLLEQGTQFREAHYRHAMTATAPGHATILTGVSASLHGIIANEWFDFSAGHVVGAVDDPSSSLVGASPVTAKLPAGADNEDSGSPRKLLATTVGDQLKLRFGAQSRVISVANKDRAAIFLGGRLADAAFWIRRDRVVTSRYYRDALPDWVQAFNAEDRINHAFGEKWERLLPAEVYERVQGPDDAPGEEQRLGIGTTFPHPFDGGRPQVSENYYDAFRLNPRGFELLGALAQRAISAEKLGQHPAPDLLCIGFSPLDYIGHSFGPDSQEVMDAFLRLDRVIAELLAFLDREVGEGKFVVVLTADHGAAPLPEHMASFNRDVTAGRIDWPALNRSVEAALTTTFGAPPANAAWTIRDSYGYRFIAATLAARGVSSSAAQRVVKETLLHSPQVSVVWTRDELIGREPAVGPFLEDWRLSFNAARSADVVLSPVPYVVDRKPAGTNHGTPYDYDNHVPLVWFGAGIRAGVRTERVGTDAIAPTLAAILGVPRPPQALADPLFKN